MTVDKCRQSGLTGRALREFAMSELDKLEGFDWSGIYRLEGDQLVLDAFVGAPTEHTHIPVGRGVCGTAVAEDRDQIIDDVHALDNYLACSLETKSEAVVLIRSNGEVVGQIDIDSHTRGRFGPAEVAMLEELAALLGERWGEP